MNVELLRMVEEVIEEAYNQVYVGKEFIYKSKYGRTKGIVKRIYSSGTLLFDEDSEMKLKYSVDHSPKGTRTMDKPELKGVDKYIATQPIFHVESTKGVHYKFSECYFI